MPRDPDGRSDYIRPAIPSLDAELDLAHDGGASPRGAAHVERPAQRFQPVAHVLQSRSLRDGSGIEAFAIVLDPEREHRVLGCDVQVDGGRLGGLDAALKRFQTAEIDGALHIAGLPWTAVDVQLDGIREPPNVCGE